MRGSNSGEFLGSQVYRHDIDHHGDVVGALGVIIQLSVEHGERLYAVEYDDIN